MYSAVLESFDKKDFLKLFRAVSCLWTADAVFSGEGFPGEDISVCMIAPDCSVTMDAGTSKSAVKDFAFSDNRESFGFFSYDLGLAHRNITTEKTPEPGYGMIRKYSAYAFHSGDKLTIETRFPLMAERIITAYESFQDDDAPFSTGDVRCNMDRDEYIGKVEKVLENIRAGQVYQLNLSMMFEAELECSPQKLWADMALEKPAPFYAFFCTEEGYILSTSPERFVRADSKEVLSQPIKGTLKGKDESLLTGSVKESAELSMIVDLIRNDISETCKPGSVFVEGHKSVMRVENLLQMYSDVRGTLADGMDAVDLLWSAFPGGSVTGCPKKRAMELIDMLEPHSRGIYCGSIFRIKDRFSVDSSIAIRTAFFNRDRIKFYSGSGIVADSVPEKEYDESVSKAEKFLGLFL